MGDAECTAPGQEMPVMVVLGWEQGEEDGKPISIKMLRRESPLGLIPLCTNDPEFPSSILPGGC